jgi:hypothetical protein
MAQENPPSATNAERAQSNSAGGLKLASIVPQTTDSGQDARRLELVWICETCSEPIANGAGWVHIDYRDINRAEKDLPPESTGFRVDLGAWMDWKPAHWQVHHKACDPDMDAPDYVIDVDRARTHAKLLNWTAHLMGKTWLGNTDWQKLIQRQAAGAR